MGMLEFSSTFLNLVFVMQHFASEQFYASLDLLRVSRERKSDRRRGEGAQVSTFSLRLPPA